MIAMNPNVPGVAGVLQPLAHDGARAMQAIVAEVTDYSERLISDGASTVSQMTSATSMTDAIQIMSAFQKRTLEETVQQSSRLLSLYSHAAQIQAKAIQAMLFPALR